MKVQNTAREIGEGLYADDCLYTYLILLSFVHGWLKFFDSIFNHSSLGACFLIESTSV